MFDQLKYNMKHNRRNVMKNVTAWGIFGIIILVFVFLQLTPHNQSLGQGGAAAVVNDQTISQAQFSEAVERLRRDPRFEQLQGLGGDQARQFMQSQAMSQLIQLELLRQANENSRIWTTDAEVAQTIYDIPQFQENGKFSGERYRSLLAANRKNPSDFESDLSNQQAVRRVASLFAEALLPMPMEVTKEGELSKMKANLEFISLPLETLIDAKSVSLADAKSFAAKPENEAAIKSYFENHKPEFDTPEEVKVRHILIRAEAGKDKDAASSEKAALAKAEDLYKRAKKEDFGKLASQYSEDPGSKAKAGVMDYFSRGKMVPEFEKVAFAAPVNEISQPVKTQFGYHLIQVLDRKPARKPNLEAVHDEIAQKLVAQERSKTALAGLEEALKKGDVAAVQNFATTNKLKWEETGTFAIDSENVPKIGPNDEVVRSAFAMTPEKPLFPGLVKQGPTAFVLRYKALDAKANKPDLNQEQMTREMAAGRRGDDALREWMEGLRKNAKIATNEELLAGGRR